MPFLIPLVIFGAGAGSGFLLSGGVKKITHLAAIGGAGYLAYHLMSKK